MSRVIIHAAGEGKRWGGYMGIPKHLVPVDGEPVLHRTVRLLLEAGESDIIVSGPYAIPRTTQYVPPKPPAGSRNAGKHLVTRGLWSPTGRTLNLFGDVYYTEAAIERMLGSHTGAFHQLCRRGPSRLTGCTHQEHFARWYWPEQHEALEASLGAYTGNPGLGDYLALALGGDELIDDWTEDFDYPDDYTRYLQRRAELAA